MSTPAITAIAISAPIIASNIVFSARRASRGVDSFDENPLYGAANVNIAGAQVLKGARAVKAVAIATDPEYKVLQEGSFSLIKKHAPKLAKTVSTDPVCKSIGKFVNYTADHVNPIIVGTSALKVTTSDDKVDTWARESTSLLTMFAAEAGAKRLLKLPVDGKITNSNDNKIAVSTKKYAKKILNEKQYNSVKNFMNKNPQTTKFACSTGKGLLFAGASIAGYKIGNKIADTILGEKEVS